MGMIATTVKDLLPAAKHFAGAVPTWQQGRAQLSDARYETYAREGYMHNPVVYACIDELATSAAEPRPMFKRGEQWLHSGEVIDLLERPNPWMTGFTYYSTIIMHRYIAGNAYGLKVRSRSGKVVERWIMRPDRVRVVPGGPYVSHYEYHVGDGEVIRIPQEDVIHYKTPHPLNDWYGMPPLMAISGQVDIDNYMADFVKSFFENAGIPGGLLSVKAKLDDDQKGEIRNRFRSTLSGPRGWHELLILDNSEATYTPMTLSLGQRGLVVPELTKLEVERICSVLDCYPPLIGYMMDSGGYNSLFALERHWWTSRIMPLWKEIGRQETLSLAPDFARVNEISFDLSDVLALQEDQDKLHMRIRENVRAGLIGLHEAREAIGFPRDWPDDEVFLVPSSAAGVGGEDLDDSGQGGEVPAGRQPAAPPPPADDEDEDE